MNQAIATIVFGKLPTVEHPNKTMSSCCVIITVQILTLQKKKMD
jgi:hypothetical protein